MSKTTIARSEMNKTISFVADESLDQSIEEECRITGRSRDEYLQDILNRHFLKKAFHRLREIAVPRGKAAGYLTDEDVFRDIS